jgi:hypothetical protein
MKKIIQLFSLIFFSTFTVSSHAKIITFKDCYSPDENKFDSKTWEKNELIVDTNLKNAKRIQIYTDAGLAAETERIIGLKDKHLGNYRPEKITIFYSSVEYADENYITLKTQSNTSNYSKFNLNLKKNNIEQTIFFNGVPVSTFIAYTCNGSSNSSSGAKDTLKKIIGK